MAQLAQVGFIGLGIMGGAISNNLLKAGHQVIGYDVSPTAIEQFVANGGQIAKSPLEVANTTPFLFTSLPTEKVIRDVFTGQDGICHSELPNVVMELSTMPLTLKMDMYRAMQEVNKFFMDCPVSGTGAQAITGDLIVFASGHQAAFESVKAIFPSMSKSNYYLGECGNGSKMKYLANLLVGIHNAAAGEVFALAGKAGMNLDDVYEVLKDSAGASKMFAIRGPMMVQDQYDQVTATVNTFMKDLSIISKFAADLNCPTPLFDTTHQLYYSSLNQGFGEADTAVVCKVLEQMAGVKR
jgi:3-hydroxyisobutyrate dehydrogenase-like beta-hydroxyacid dehydrogenase